MSNLPSLTTGAMIKTLTDLFIRMSPRTTPSIMIWSAPGVGKSEGCCQVATNVGKVLQKKAIITDIRLLLFQAIDLRGIPVADANKEFAIWLRPQIFDMDPSENIINFLILDEISAAPPSVQAAAYQLTLDRKIGEHALPDNCYVICCGNRVTDKSVAYKPPKALCNRLIHLELKPTVEDWKKNYAIPNNIDARIISYMNKKAVDSALFDFDASSDDLAFRTPRSWSFVNSLIEDIDDVQSIFPLIAGTIGPGSATDFTAYCRFFEKIPDINKIFTGECKDIPKEPDVLYALSGALFGSAQKQNQVGINHMCDYLENISSDVAYLVIKDCLTVPELRIKICTSPGWSRYMLQKWSEILLSNDEV